MNTGAEGAENFWGVHFGKSPPLAKSPPLVSGGRLTRGGLFARNRTDPMLRNSRSDKPKLPNTVEYPFRQHQRILSVSTRSKSCRNGYYPLRQDQNPVETENIRFYTFSRYPEKSIAAAKIEMLTDGQGCMGMGDDPETAERPNRDRSAGTK